jgi:type II secretory pathway pseudopilin PulG
MFVKLGTVNGDVIMRARGFSLIEVALVLGVVGLVIGGVWFAAANVSENQKASKTVEELSSIAMCARSQFNPTDNLTDAASELANAGCLPSPVKTAIIDMSGRKIITSAGPVHPFINGDGYLIYQLWGPEGSLCSKIVNGMIKNFGSSNQTMERIRLHTMSGYSYPTPPYNLGPAPCKDQLSIQFQFKLPGRGR